MNICHRRSRVWNHVVRDGVAFLWVSVVSYLALRKLAFLSSIDIFMCSRFHVLRLMFKGLAWGDLPKNKCKRKRGEKKNKRWLISTI